MPRLIDRRVREDWAAAGATDIRDRAAEEAQRILEHHTPPPLPESVTEEMRGIVAQLDAALGGS